MIKRGFDFDYDIRIESCAFKTCDVECVFHDAGSETAGSWMTCKKGKSDKWFCTEHRPHEIHKVECQSSEEEEEEK